MAGSIADLKLKLEILELTHEALLIKLDAYSMVNAQELPELLSRYHQEYNLQPEQPQETEEIIESESNEEDKDEIKTRRFNFVIQKPFDEWGISRQIKRLVREEPESEVTMPATLTFEEILEQQGPAGSSLNDAKKVAYYFLHNDKVMVNDLVTGNRSRATVIHYLKKFKSSGFIVYNADEDEKHYSVSDSGKVYFESLIQQA